MIVLDLEWNRSYDKIPLEEILQIGAVRIDGPGGRITDTFSVFIRPRVHKKLNRSAKALPELQSSLDAELDFPTALALFQDWCGGDTEFAGWGGDDLLVLRQNCAFWRLPLPKTTRQVDFQAAFSLAAGTRQNVALSRAVEYCGLPDSFTFHNALNDAMYTALVSAWTGPETLALLELSKEARRLADTALFPPQPPRQAGPYATAQAALNGRGCRRQLCPLCGASLWVRRWYPAGNGGYYAEFRCPSHGRFPCRLTLSATDSGQWQAVSAVPAVTPELLTDFDRALLAGSVPCKGGKGRKKRRRRCSGKKR